MNRAHILGEKILEWYWLEEPRGLPWKSTVDPYKIWISEIMSQQTRIEHVISYYEKFITRFPTITEMARSDEDTILSMWSGLGYYSRARNLYKTACIVAEEWGGVFPRKYEEVRGLPGIGDYTAAAICSFAYGNNYPVIDANVERIYARYNAVADNLKTKAGRIPMMEFLHRAIEGRDPAVFNQAIMDFGAIVCKPINPDCENCPLRLDCDAYQSGTVDLFPVKRKQIARKKRMFHYLVLKNGDTLYLRKRKGRDIWENMWEFPQIEIQSEEAIGELLQCYNPESTTSQVSEISAVYAQTLSHQEITARFYLLENSGLLESEPFKAVKIEDLSQYAFPGIIRQYLHREFKLVF